MSRIYRTKLWQATLPDGWLAGGSQDLVTIWDPEGVGQLRVLAVEEAQPPPRNGSGKEFAGNLRGWAYDSSGGRRQWTLLCGSQWIYVIYSCAGKNVELERKQIDEILQSLSEAV